jgi:hypothetical protein
MMERVAPDKPKAIALRKASERIIARLDHTPKYDFPSDTLIDYYSALHCVLEAYAVERGFKTKGEGAHQILIDWICDQRNISFKLRKFLQQLREIRNKAYYDGFEVPPNFLPENEPTIKHIIALLSQE